MRAESLSGLQIERPRARQEGFIVVALILFITSREQSPDNPPCKWQRSQREVPEEGVFANKAHRREDVSCRSLDVGCCIFTGNIFSINKTLSI
jgi:hypothetical protein